MTSQGFFKNGWKSREILLILTAIVIPAAFGIIWLTAPAYVFLAGAGTAVNSLILAMMVPRDPQIGNETKIFCVAPDLQLAE